MIISELEIRLSAQIARLQQDMDSARRIVGNSLGRMSVAAEAFKGLLSGVAAGLSIGAFFSFTKNSIDAADALNDMSVRTKVAIEDLAGLAYAAKLGDTSLEGVASSISKLGQNIGKDGAKFRALGVTATEPLEAFKQLADIFKNIQDPQQRAAFGAEALGKSWQEAAVLLDGGSEGISKLIDRGKELSGVTEQVAADAGAFNDKLDELTFAAQGAGTRIAAGLLPTLQKIADSFSSNSVNSKELEGTITVLSGVLKTLYSVGVGVAAMFVALGKSIGGTATIAVAALSGDFTGALAAYKTMAADVYTGLGDAAIQIGKAWVDTAKGAEVAADAGDAMADKLIAQATAVKVATFLNSSEIAGARDKAAAQAEAAVKKEQSAYAGLIASIREKTAADQAEVLGTGPLSDAQKLRIKLDEELKAGKISLTKEHVAEARALIDVAEVLEKSAKGLAAYNTIRKELAEQTQKVIQAAQDEADKNEELVKTFGLTAAAITKVELARLQDQLAQRASAGLTLDEIAALESLIEAKKRSAAATGSLEVLEKQKKASDEAAAAQVSFWKSIDQTAHDTFISIANGSKDAATRLKETFKNVFFDWLYQMTIKKWIVNIGPETSSGSTASSIASLFSGSGTGSSGGNSAGGMLGTASNWLSIGKTIYSGFTTGIASTMGGYITNLGNLFGSQAVSAFGAGMQGGLTGAMAAAGPGATATTATAASAGATAASAIPIIGWIIAGMNAANGFRKEGFTANNGTITNPILQAGALPTNFAEKTMKAIGFNDAIANILSGAAINTKLFGRADPRVEAQGLRGTVSAAGFDADSYAKIIEKGGIFRSSKRYEKSADLDAATDKAWDETIANMITSVKGFGSAMGTQTSVIDGYSKTFDLKLTGKAEEDNAAVAKLFGDIGDEMSLRLVPGLAAFAKEGETMSATLQRLAVDYQTVDAILTATGQSIKVFGAAGIQVREDMIAAAGGLEQLTAGVSYFQQNWLSQAEQLAPVQKQVAEALAAMGMSAVKTNDQFKAAVLGIDLNTKAGAELYVKMLALAPAFKVAADAADAAAQVASEAAKQAAVVAAQAAKDLVATLLANVDDAFAVLQRVVEREKVANAQAHAVEMKAIQVRMDASTASVAKQQALSDMLKSSLDAMSLSGTGDGDARIVGQAQIQAALAMAKAGGVLPNADSLKQALSSVTKDASDQFATYDDYLTDFYKTQNDIAALGKITDASLSVEQRTLDLLQAQKDASQTAYDAEVARLDEIVETARSQIDVLNGMDTSLLTIDKSLQAVLGAIMKAQANSSISSNAAIVKSYQENLGRNPDKAGLEFYQQQAAAGTSMGGIDAAIKGSGEAQIQALFKNLLGRNADAGGLKYWLDAFNSGTSLTNIAAAIKADSEYKSLHSFAVGTNSVPYDMLANIHKDERIIPAADNRELMSQLRSPPADTSAELIAELRAQRDEERSENEQLRQVVESHLLAIAKSNLNIEGFLDGAVNGETPLAMKEITAEETA